MAVGRSLLLLYDNNKNPEDFFWSSTYQKSSRKCYLVAYSIVYEDKNYKQKLKNLGYLYLFIIFIL